jgi:hypothetical protein
MTLTHILVESRTLLQKAMTELQNNGHKRVCWPGNYEIKLCKQNKYIINKLMKKQGIDYMEQGHSYWYDQNSL